MSLQIVSNQLFAATMYLVSKGHDVCTHFSDDEQYVDIRCKSNSEADIRGALEQMDVDQLYTFENEVDMLIEDCE